MKVWNEISRKTQYVLELIARRNSPAGLQVLKVLSGKITGQLANDDASSKETAENRGNIVGKVTNVQIM